MSMNVFFLFYRQPHFFQLAGAKVQLIFKPASFLKKKLFFLFSLLYPVKHRDLLSPIPSGLGGQR